MVRTKEQDAARHRTYYKSNREKEVSRVKTWNKSYPERKAANTRKGLYGIDKAGTDRLYEAQGGLCAICTRPLNGKFHVDHCHTSGRVRGLLCKDCNLGLGRMHDSVETLQNAVLYLQQFHEDEIRA